MANFILRRKVNLQTSFLVVVIVTLLLAIVYSVTIQDPRVISMSMKPSITRQPPLTLQKVTARSMVHLHSESSARGNQAPAQYQRVYSSKRPMTNLRSENSAHAGQTSTGYQRSENDGFSRSSTGSSNGIPSSELPMSTTASNVDIGADDYMAVILLTYMRSGSSITGDILEQHPGVFYVFEPLKLDTNYAKQNKSIAFFNETILEHGSYDLNAVHRDTMRGWLTCDFSMIHVQSMVNFMFMEFGKKTKMLSQCLISRTGDISAKKAVHERPLAAYKQGGVFRACVDELQNTCRSSKYRIIKVIRASMSNAWSVVKDIPNGKVIHLNRDPRATISSKSRMGTCFKPNFGGVLGCATLHCNRVRDDTKLREFAQKRNMERFHTVLYEDMALKPIETAKCLYNFLGMEFTSDLTNYVYKVTLGDDKSECVVCQSKFQMGKSNKSSETHIDKWKSNLKPEYIRGIQERCKDIMETYGYDFYDIPSPRPRVPKAQAGLVPKEAKTLGGRNPKAMTSPERSVSKATSSPDGSVAKTTGPPMRQKGKKTSVDMDKMTSFITPEMVDHHWPVALPKRTIYGNNYTAVILLTYMRSGSSVTGDILQQDPDVFYLYEPFRTLEKSFKIWETPISFMNGTVLEHGTYDMVHILREALRGWLTCDFSRVFAESIGDMGFLGYGKRTLVHSDCLKAAGPKFYYIFQSRPSLAYTHPVFRKCVGVLQDTCLSSKYRIIKTVRSSMLDAWTAVNDIPNSKIIHLNRDPRATMKSMDSFGKCDRKGNTLEQCITEYCGRVRTDSALRTYLQSSAPNNFFTVRYEDILTQTDATCSAMYNFVGMTYTQRISGYIHNVTRGEDMTGCTICQAGFQRGGKKGVESHLVKWQGDSFADYVTITERNCGDIIKNYGYEPSTGGVTKVTKTVTPSSPEPKRDGKSGKKIAKVTRAAVAPSPKEPKRDGKSTKKVRGKRPQS